MAMASSPRRTLLGSVTVVVFLLVLRSTVLVLLRFPVSVPHVSTITAPITSTATRKDSIPRQPPQMMQENLSSSLGSSIGGVDEAIKSFIKGRTTSTARTETTITNTNAITASLNGARIVDDEDASDTVAYPPSCTAEQLDIVQQQLPPEECERNRRRPWYNQCSFSYATRCPDAVWLDEYFRSHAFRDEHVVTDPDVMRPPPPVGVYIGCNKAMDAVNTLRMLSSDPRIDKEVWRRAFLKDQNYAPGHCGQEHDEQWEIHVTNGTAIHSPIFDTVVHCIEAMPVTAERLASTVRTLAWQDNLHVIHAAMAAQDGVTWFPAVRDKVGVEGLGIGNCAPNKPGCEQVPMLSLNTLLEKHVARASGQPSGYVDLLSIDVEGFDWEVLRGGNETLSSRVKYLEFEYNWKGKWSGTDFAQAVSTLREQNFCCYWIGTKGHIWRITDCFLPHYHFKHWSNVACVNLAIPSARPLAQRMEQLFQKTLAEGSKIRYDKAFFDGQQSHA